LIINVVLELKLGNMFFDIVLPGKTNKARLPFSNAALIRGMTHPVVLDMPHAPACIAILFI
jgi:hypothetical protein